MTAPRTAGKGAASLVLALAFTAPACGVLGGGAGAATQPGAHVLFLIRPACNTVVARTLAVGDARAFTVITLRDPDYAPQVGDLLEGPTREGESVFTYHAPENADTHGGGSPITVDVDAVGLTPGEARARLDAVCGPPTLPPGGN